MATGGYQCHPHPYPWKKPVKTRAFPYPSPCFVRYICVLRSHSVCPTASFRCILDMCSTPRISVPVSPRLSVVCPCASRSRSYRLNCSRLSSLSTPLHQRALVRPSPPSYLVALRALSVALAHRLLLLSSLRSLPLWPLSNLSHPRTVTWSIILEPTARDLLEINISSSEPAQLASLSL